MQQLLEILNQGWIGSVIGIIGIIVGIYCYCLSTKKAKFVYQKASLRSFDKQKNFLPRECIVQFRGKQIDRLNHTLLILWNDGTQTIGGESIADKDPLRVVFNEGDNILSSIVSKQTRAINEFTLIEDKSNPHILGLTYSFLDPGDGATIEIMHDSKLRYPSIRGTIRGIPDGLVDLGGPSVGPIRSVRNRVSGLSLTNKVELMMGFAVGVVLIPSTLVAIRALGGNVVP